MPPGDSMSGVPHGIAWVWIIRLYRVPAAMRPMTAPARSLLLACRPRLADASDVAFDELSARSRGPADSGQGPPAMDSGRRITSIAPGTMVIRVMTPAPQRL